MCVCVFWVSGECHCNFACLLRSGYAPEGGTQVTVSESGLLGESMEFIVGRFFMNILEC